MWCVYISPKQLDIILHITMESNQKQALKEGDPMDIDTDEAGRPPTGAMFSDTGQLSVCDGSDGRTRHFKAIPLSKLIKRNAFDSFVNDCESILKDWVLLLHRTTLPQCISSSDNRILKSFRILNRVIRDKSAGTFMSRLAWLQLTKVLDFVETIVKSERASGLIHRARGYGNASIALDIYHCAEKGVSRKTLVQRKRFAARWTKLAGPSPLLLLIYSSGADNIVYVSSILRLS